MMKQPKLKLSLKKETLRPLEDKDLEVLDSVVGGTCIITCNGTCLFASDRDVTAV